MIKYSNNKDDISKNIEDYNPNKRQKILIVFDDKIVDMLCNKKLDPAVTELFFRGRKLEVFLVFITITFCCSKRYLTKFSTLLCHENSKQKRALTNCV